MPPWIKLNGSLTITKCTRWFLLATDTKGLWTQLHVKVLSKDDPIAAHSLAF